MTSEEEKRVVAYTDGACIGNPGPGGYGVVLLYRGNRKELSSGFRETTNNRMELMAAIVALETLKEKCSVTLYTDSQYVSEGITKGWAANWRARGWRKKKGKALNPDLWTRLLDLCEFHDVEFIWVAGHTGIPENERCDQLSFEAANMPGLPRDPGFEPLSDDDRYLGLPLFDDIK